MQTHQLLRLVRMAGRGKAGIAGAVVLGVILVGTWWFQDGAGAGDGQTPDPRPSASAAVSTPPTTSSPEASSPSATSDAPTEVEGTDPASGLPYVAAADLPPEAGETLERIDAGGPFPYPDNDGVTFHNFEGILPDEPDGYYREYTVETPGLDHRGARRIVTGDGGEFYWTADHYESFSVIVR